MGRVLQKGKRRKVAEYHQKKSGTIRGGRERATFTFGLKNRLNDTMLKTPEVQRYSINTLYSRTEGNAFLREEKMNPTTEKNPLEYEKEGKRVSPKHEQSMIKL